MTSRELIRELRELEREGRERAYDDQSVPIGDIEFLDRIRKSVMRIKKYSDFTDAISEAAIGISVLADLCKAEGIPRRECRPMERNFERALRESMRKMDMAYKKYSGEGCTWLSNDPRNPFNLSVAINDLTACLHRLIELEEKAVQKRIGRKSAIVEFRGARVVSSLAL